MSEIGVNLDPLNPAGWPPLWSLRAFGAEGVRWVPRPGLRSHVDDCNATGLPVLATFTHESGDPEQYQGWPFRLVAVGNEMDGKPGGSSEPLTPEDFYQRWYRCLEVFPDTPLLIGAMVSGQVWRAERYACVEGAAGLCVHPYDKPVEPARALIREYREAYGLPVYVTEWWRPAEEIPEFLAMLEEETAGFWWFSWHSFPGWSGGLMDESGAPRPEYYALREALAEMATLRERVELLERQQGLQTEALRRLFDGEPIAGGVESVQAVMYALDPQLQATNWTPRLQLPKA